MKNYKVILVNTRDGEQEINYDYQRIDGEIIKRVIINEIPEERKQLLEQKTMRKLWKDLN